MPPVRAADLEGVRRPRRRGARPRPARRTVPLPGRCGHGDPGEGLATAARIRPEGRSPRGDPRPL